MTKAQSSNESGAAAAAKSVDWSAVLAEHQHWLRTVVWARLGGPEGVDEVLQEVSLATVRQSAPLNDVAKVAPWLHRLAVLQALLYRRRRGRQRKLIDRFVERRPPAEHDPAAADPLVWLLADERRKLIRTAVRRLPPRDAEILLLKYTENWSYHQLAQRLGISHAAVEARLHRARGRLRNELTALEVIEVHT